MDQRVTQIPDGYRMNAQGHLVPVATIKDIDIARDELVREIVNKAKELHSAIARFKAGTFEDIQAFIELSAEKYGAKIGGNKGNVTLMSFDGRYKIQRTVAENITFDERLQAAKQLIDECIHAWSEGVNDNIRALVNDAFRVDKEGDISIGRVLGLRRLDIKDAKWQQAMAAISDAVQVIGSKSYVRIYERQSDIDKWEPIPLDVASVPLDVASV